MKRAKVQVTAADVEDVDNPPLTDEELSRFRPIQEVAPEILALIRRHRGPQKRPTKQLLSLRLDPDLIEHFRAGGRGWQARLNATLRKAVGL